MYSAKDGVAKVADEEVNVFKRSRPHNGEVPEWSKGADCKSAGSAFGGSNPPLSTTQSALELYSTSSCNFENEVIGGNSSVG
jgi:hypothetical protein